MKRKRKGQDVYTPLSWCDRMSVAYQQSIRKGITPERILDITKLPNDMTEEQKSACIREMLSCLSASAKNVMMLKNLQKAEMFDAVESMAAMKLWSYNKQVYRLDNDFIRELLNTDEVFYEKDSWNYLPYRMFYLDIEECPEYYKAFSCTGLFVYVFNLIESGKEKVIIRVYRISDDRFIKDSFELGNESDQLGFYNLSETKEEVYTSHDGEEKIQSNIRGLMTMVVQVLNYLSSVQPDIEENPQTKKTYRKPAPHTEPKNKFSEIKKWDVGVRFGTAYRAWKKEQEEIDKEESAGTAHSRHGKVRPHCRKAHWSHFWYGSGENKVRRAKWLSECFVGTKTEEIPAVIHRCEGEKSE